ncbi:hemerythrin domain-containing protein [Saccharothrix sp. NPDC042600]|uniref:hemerythrin domain-containing protein n=1 Tax=Saccharothrix TaxID=2071 RepID=UPI0033EB8B97
MIDADVVAVLVDQHTRIRDLFTAVETGEGDERATAFARLVRLLALHEAAEEVVVHPAARGVEGGDAVVEDRLGEEQQARELLARLGELGPDHPEFADGLAGLRQAVLEHANHEESYEFRYLRSHYDTTELADMAALVRAAERVAPHAAPGEVDPALFDRVGEAVRESLLRRR